MYPWGPSVLLLPAHSSSVLSGPSRMGCLLPDNGKNTMVGARRRGSREGRQQAE